MIQLGRLEEAASTAMEASGSSPTAAPMTRAGATC